MKISSSAGNLDPLAEEDEDIREVDDGDSLSSDDSMVFSLKKFPPA